MGASKTRTAQTAFGDVEYETVDCASCGIEIRKEDARRFVIGELQERKEWHTLGKDEFTFDSRTVQTGWACEYCREQGVFGFPDSRVWKIILAHSDAAMWVMVVANILMAMVVLLIALAFG